MCTKEDTTKTGINIETVSESKLKPHSIFSDSESIHLNKCIETGMSLKPTSIKLLIASNVVAITKVHEIKWDPVTPTFLPKKPETIDAKKGKTIIAKYIIYTLLQYYLLIYKKLLGFLTL